MYWITTLYNAGDYKYRYIVEGITDPKIKRKFLDPEITPLYFL